MEFNEIKEAYIKLETFAKESFNKSIKENRIETAKYLSGFLDGVYMMYREIEGSEEAFETLIPKKPINEGCYYLCPCCQGDLGVSDDDIFIYELPMPKYCSNCGCMLDWSEVNAAALTKTVEAVDVKNDVCVHCLPQERGLINSIKKEKVEY